MFVPVLFVSPHPLIACSAPRPAPPPAKTFAVYDPVVLEDGRLGHRENWWETSWIWQLPNKYWVLWIFLLHANTVGDTSIRVLELTKFRYVINYLRHNLTCSVRHSCHVFQRGFVVVVVVVVLLGDALLYSEMKPLLFVWSGCGSIGCGGVYNVGVKTKSPVLRAILVNYFFKIVGLELLSSKFSISGSGMYILNRDVNKFDRKRNEIQQKRAQGKRFTWSLV